MNYWLRRAELKDVEKQILKRFGGMIFKSPQLIYEYWDKIKTDLNINRKLLDVVVYLEISEITSKQYQVESIVLELKY